jgi:hypothetical protein
MPCHPVCRGMWCLRARSCCGRAHPGRPSIFDIGRHLSRMLCGLAIKVAAPARVLRWLFGDSASRWVGACSRTGTHGRRPASCRCPGLLLFGLTRRSVLCSFRLGVSRQDYSSREGECRSGVFVIGENRVAKRDSRPEWHVPNAFYSPKDASSLLVQGLPADPRICETSG